MVLFHNDGLFFKVQTYSKVKNFALTHVAKATISVMNLHDVTAYGE